MSGPVGYTNQSTDRVQAQGAVITAFIMPAGPSPDRLLQVRALIDTGCNRTGILPSVARQLGLKSVGISRFCWLGSRFRKKARLYRVQFFFADGPIWPQLLVSEFAYMQPGIQCLIGRDVLSCGEFIYDGVAGEWTLTFPAGKQPNLIDRLTPG